MIYFDNAATTFPKPESVVSEVSKCLAEYCGNPGRGSHALSMRASEAVYSARESVCALFNGYSPDRCIFTLNTTYALNISLKAAVSKGCRVLISDLEHNSVYRQVEKLKAEGIADYDVFGTYSGDREKIINDVKRKIKFNTKVLICQIASNICGVTMPVEEIGKLCRKNLIVFIADAAQYAGIREIDVKRMNIDALCFPAHKGLYGPQGAGGILLSDAFSENAPTLIEGGSGSDSLNPLMPESYPDRYEAGTCATPALAGLMQGIKFVRNIGYGNISEHEREMTSMTVDALLSDRRFEVYCPMKNCGIVLFNVKGIDPVSVGRELDARGICVRSGFHCAPLAHRTLGTGNSGAVRVSFGIFNYRDEVRKMLDALYYILK